MDDTVHEAVVFLALFGSYTGTGCTGTFIAPNLIITAAHCVSCNISAESGQGCACQRTKPPQAGQTDRFCHTNWEPSRDGTILGTTGNKESAAYDGVARRTGKRYDIDYVWIPKPISGSDRRVDVAVLHTVQPFAKTPMKLLDRSALPNASNRESFNGEDVTLVGYSQVEWPDSRRRQGVMQVTGTYDSPEFIPAEGLWLASDTVGASSGDSGGPVIFTVMENGQQVERLGAVYSWHVNAHDPPYYNGAGYIPTDLLDDLCPSHDFWNCHLGQKLVNGVWEDDTDQDGLVDSQDNCPTVANVDQANCDYEAENKHPQMPKLQGIPAGHLLHLGDACDPEPCASFAQPFGATAKVSQQGEILGGAGFPGIYWERIGGGPVVVASNNSQFQQGSFETLDVPGVRPHYCHCQHPNGQWIPSSQCMTAPCPSEGDNQYLDLDVDRGYQTLRWLGARFDSGSRDCPIAIPDPDGNSRHNECVQAVGERTFYRLFGGRSSPLCTSRGELGCSAGDSRGWWAGGRADSYLWEWRSQDLPHEDDGSHDPSLATSARVRLWLHAESAGAHAPTARNEYGNSYTEPTDLSRGETRLVVLKPLYAQKPWRWVLASAIEPWGPREVFTPMPRDLEPGQLPDGWSWLDDVEQAATRALVTSSVIAGPGALGAARPGTFVGEPDQAFETTAFAAARFGGAAFTFGGETGDGQLSHGLWYGVDEQNAQYWQPVAGAETSALLSTSTATVTAATSAAAAQSTATKGQTGKGAPGGKAKGTPSPATMPKGKCFSSWRSELLAKHKAKRTSLAQIALQQQSAFSAAMQAFTGASSSSSNTSLASSSSTAVVAPRSFGPGTPLPQKHAVLIGDNQQNTLVALFGQLERPRGVDEPVPVAVFDL